MVPAVLEALWLLTALTALTKLYLGPHWCVWLTKLCQETPALLMVLVRL